MLQRENLTNAPDLDFVERTEGKSGRAREEQRRGKDDPAFDGIVGRITATGFVPYAPVPASTWSKLPVSSDASLCEYRCWQLHVIDDQLWQGHCKFVETLDASTECAVTHHTRIDRPDGRAFDKLPIGKPPRKSPASLRPSQHVTLAFVDGAVQCKFAGKTTLYPEDRSPEESMCERCVTWISHEPPVFAMERVYTTEWSSNRSFVVFDRCEPSSVEAIEHGNAGLVAVLSRARIEVFQRGRRIGSLDVGGELAAFAP